MVLNACVVNRPRLPTVALDARLSAHEERVLPLQDFQLQGRVALSDGRDGGSGRLRWQQGGQLLQVRFDTGLAGRSFELRHGPDGATLVDSSGERQQHDDVDRLLRDAWGIEVPIHALSYWMRGARQPGHDGLIKLDDANLPLQLTQHGWQVDYLTWQNANDPVPALPTKLYAQRDEQSVRLVVQRWIL